MDMIVHLLQRTLVISLFSFTKLNCRSQIKFLLLLSKNKKQVESYIKNLPDTNMEPMGRLQCQK